MNVKDKGECGWLRDNNKSWLRAKVVVVDDDKWRSLGPPWVEFGVCWIRMRKTAELATARGLWYATWGG